MSTLNKQLIRLLLLGLLTPVVLFGCQPNTPKKNGYSAYTNSRKALVPQDPLSVRSMAYAFELENLEEEIISLRDFRGKLVLVNFWATWCAPCIAEMPALEELYQELKNDGLVVVAISVDSQKARGRLSAFVRNNGLSFPVLRDMDGATAEQYRVGDFPESFFVSPKGKLLAVSDPQTKKRVLRILGEREWNSPEYVDWVQGLLEKTNETTVEIS